MTIMNEERLSSAPHKPADVVPFLEAYIAKKEEEIAEIEQMVSRYEERRLKEERAYQAMSSLRKLLSGRKPAHHLAVEYIHYIKQPMERARMLRHEIERARALRDSAVPEAAKLSELESFR
ncbi:hypothetical protein H8B09_02050 [Paenibacillus sp. PR3]|uniref:Uncharacterized protein n=1 Tax=Paenibacillus terricola TaxID=2763503 RepID=A0ABR8MND6_9BACL|nr:hypothetical protein [Paenibacillus terricola]MBD3917522.1 hypothetical protein [Paenibacillus terricola]